VMGQGLTLLDWLGCSFMAAGLWLAAPGEERQVGMTRVRGSSRWLRTG
jgi:hypothetical protein